MERFYANIILYIFEFLSDEDIASFILTNKYYYSFIGRYVQKHKKKSIKTLHKHGQFIILCAKHQINIRYYINNSIVLTKLLIKRGVEDFNTILINACANGNSAIVKLMLENGAKCIGPASFIACKNNHIEVVSILICQLKMDYMYGMYGACEGGNLNMFKIMFKELGSAMKVTMDIMYHAYRGGNSDIIKILLEQPNLNRDVCMYGACRSGNLDVVTTLLKYYNVMPTIPLLRYYNARFNLIDACIGNNNKIIELLIKLGADDYFQAIAEACAKGNVYAVNLILERDSSLHNWALYNAARYGHLNIVKMMIELGANHYDSTLEIEIVVENIDLIKFLIPHHYGDYHRAFANACKREHIETIKLLSSYCTDFHIGLYSACEVKNLYIVNMVLAYSAKRYGDDYADIVELLLLDDSEDYNEIDAYNGTLKIIKMLIDNNSRYYGGILDSSIIHDINRLLKSIDNSRPMIRAINKNNFDIVRELLELSPIDDLVFNRILRSAWISQNIETIKIVLLIYVIFN